MKINRPFAFWGARAKRLRALREGRESPALQGRTGSRDVTEVLRGQQPRKGRLTKVSRPFVFLAHSIPEEECTHLWRIARLALYLGGFFEIHA